ncbi:MAG TPA: DUF1049 domain-containing protein [Firmicutes bacterium]|nr:DUF1049 domain-containing protein [Bacillota bacterium]
MMSSFYLILALVFGLLIAIVALANQEAVSVNYIFGRSEVSLIILILGSAFVGALAMGLFSLFRGIQSAFSFRQLRQKQDEMQKKIKDLEEEKIFLTAEINKLSSVQEEVAEEKTAEDETAAENSVQPVAEVWEEKQLAETEEGGPEGSELTEMDEADKKNI